MIKDLLKKIWITLKQRPDKNEDGELPIVKELRSIGISVGTDAGIWSCCIDKNYPELLTIGNHVTISYSTILTHDSSTLRATGFRKIGKVTICDNVFIGYGSIVLPGTIIHENVIVGAGSIVKGDLEGNSVYVSRNGRIAERVGSFEDYLSKHKALFKHKTASNLPWHALSSEEKAELRDRMTDTGIYYIPA